MSSPIPPLVTPTKGDLNWWIRTERTAVLEAAIRELIDSQAAGIGLEVRRNISQGAPLIKSSIQQPMAIKRGEIVTIAAKAGTITVNTTGSALNDGRLGQKIRVRNSQSNRVITGRVVAEGKVQI